MTKTLSKTPLALAIEAAKALLPNAHKVEGVDRAGVATSTDVNDPVFWQQCGSDDANRERGSEGQLNLIRALLKDAPFPIWAAFSECYKAGAEAEQYKDPANLLHKRVYAPLSAEGINKPQSPTSSAARPKSADAEAAATKRKADADALTAMADDAIAAEVKEGKADPARMSALFGEMAKRSKATASADAKAAREARATARKPLIEVIDSMTIAEMQKVHTFASALVAKRSKAK